MKVEFDSDWFEETSDNLSLVSKQLLSPVFIRQVRP